jgi:AcrR family transcriptional regulator
MSRRDQILDAAERLLSSEGREALTKRRVAAELGIQAPSLYKHVRSKDDIEAGLQERALVSMAEALAPASDLPAIASAYRGWALSHPHLYAVATSGPLHRDRLSPGVEEAAAAPVVMAADGDEHRARALWALAHGLVSLELAGRFPPGADLDQTWAAAVTAF